MSEENRPGVFGGFILPWLPAAGAGTIGAWVWWRNRQPLSTTDAMAGRVCVVTGANAGIGKATAMALARQGAHVILACRSPSKGDAASRDIRRRVSGATVQVMPLDLESTESIRGFVKRFRETNLPLHVLVNNAGVLTGKLETVRGMEKTMVVNHLGPFLLTHLLLPNLQKSAAPHPLGFGGQCAPENSLQNDRASRIVNVASRLEKRGELPAAKDPASATGTVWFQPPPGKHDAFRQYGASKLCNMLFTFELHRRLAATTAPASDSGGAGRVTVSAVTPGMVNTGLGDNIFSPWVRPMIKLSTAPIKALLLRTVDKGAETVVWAASSPELEGSSGKFFGDLKECSCSEASQDAELARKLWEASEVATGLNESERMA